MNHDVFPAADLPARDCYRLLTDFVAPRPIAWVSTVSPAGARNLAPFSYFQGVCSRPPTVILGLGWFADGRMKDTLRNILDTRELTVNHVTEPMAEAMNATSKDFAPDVSEWEAVGIEATPASVVGPPRVKGAVAGMECRLTHAIPLGETPAGKPSSTLVVAQVVAFFAREGLIRRDESGKILPSNPGVLDAVGRLGGIAYTRTRDRMEFPRP